MEEYYEGKALNMETVRDPVISRKIFARIAELHQLKIAKIPTKPLILRVLDNKPMIIDKVLKKIKEGKFTDQQKNYLKDIIKMTSKEEIDFLKSIMPTSTNSVVFCHNDLIDLNMIQVKETSDKNDIKFIDFEYG